MSLARKRLAPIAVIGVVAGGLMATTTPAQAADPVEVNILGINDFHGRIQANGNEAGAAVLAGAVDQIRGEHPNTIFAAAGDLIGASTFESFIAQDKPTIDALNAAGLEVSAAGNHEFDQGYRDLVDRVLAPYDAETNPYGGAEWEYLAANVKMKDSGNPALDPTYVKTIDGVEVGFVGAVTEDLPQLVSGTGIEEIEVTDIVTAVNTEADKLKADGVDLVVMLVHEGAPNTTCETMDDDPESSFGSIVTGVNANVDAIVSGHTHLAYDCKFPVAGWTGRAVTERPVVSAGQYGMNLNQLTFTVDPDTGVTGVETALLDLTPTPAYPADAEVGEIVSAAVAEAEVLGAEPLGEIAGGFFRAKRADGSTENRGGESTLGNLVAEAQRWATGADIAFMNPGGMRADMVGVQDTDPATPLAFPTTLTYKQAASVQPFANTLVEMTLTGAQIESVLEEQWQPEASSRPFLRLGASKGFEYTYDATAKEVTGIWLDGKPVEESESYTVAVNSFLATGTGDNFTTFGAGTARRDSGQIDLNAMVDYMAKFAGEDPLTVDYSQRAVGATFPAEAPEAYGPGDSVSFELSSLAMSAPADIKDDEVEVRFKGQSLGSFPVDNTIVPGAGFQEFDEHGTASVSVTLPDYAGDPDALVVVGDDTGTKVKVGIDTIAIPKAEATVTVKRSPKRVVAGQTKVMLKVTVKSATEAGGKVKVRAGGRAYTAKVVDGQATVTLKPFAKAGKKTVTVRYLGDALTARDVKKLTVKVVKK
ncbi:bifunctional metallophosphatase/5'-nucleotidase [Nocardioides ferulae]|uniref:bifunctional metallophosphatase/5'-nucleotidase n=1 Tax=Nocardioides ferulae TaxID=2340821 RepID=UPI000EB36C6F|nr:bifunctional UDP-sugar hydrolase/5'-nucleotidase [Nocardioides ferulae]